MADETRTPIEAIYHRSGLQDNLRIWGKLYINRVGGANSGWLVDSWGENRAPYWRPRMHWLAKKDDKLYSVKLDIGMLGGRTTLVGEDTEIEPERAKYVRANVEKWEVEWLEQEAKKSRLAAIVAFRACFRSLEPLCRTA